MLSMLKPTVPALLPALEVPGVAGVPAFAGIPTAFRGSRVPTAGCAAPTAAISNVDGHGLPAWSPPV